MIYYYHLKQVDMHRSLKLLLLSVNGLIRIFPSIAQDEEYVIKILKEHSAAVNSVAISPDQKYLVTGGEDKLLAIFDFTSLEPVHKYPENYFAPHGLVLTLANNIFVGSGNDIKLIDLNSKTLAVYEGNTTPIFSIDYAPERNLITAGSYDYKLKVWDVTSSKIVFMLTGHQKNTLAVAFSPDEKYIVSGSLDKTVKVWNAKSGELMHSLEKHSDNIYDIEFHPSGKFFASASRDLTIRLWDFETGEVVKTYAGHDKGIMDIAFTPDGNHLLSASIDGSIRLWETKTAKMVYTFTGHEGAVNCLALSPDGSSLVSGGADSKVIVWKLSKKIFVEYAFYDEFQAEKEASGQFAEKGKGEKKEDYEIRMIKARQIENEIIERYYQQYIKKLRELPL
jgi:tricorn protease-like protein